MGLAELDRRTCFLELQVRLEAVHRARDAVRQARIERHAGRTLQLVKAVVQAKLVINKPGYDTHDAAAEAAVVA